MSRDIQNVTENKVKSVEDKIHAQFNEEKWTRLTAKDVSISRFNLFENLFEEIEQENKIDFLKEVSEQQIKDYNNSLTARFFLGIISLEETNPEGLIHLKQLLDEFQSLSKWVVVEYLCNKVLVKVENRAILKTLSIALEKLGKTTEIIGVLEKLVQTDKRNPEIALKYADAIIEEDIEKAIFFYKQATEIYAKNLEYEKLKFAWNKLTNLVPEDFTFYRKIERILSSHRQKEIISDLYIHIAYIYIKKEDIDNTIFLCKKVLEYNPNFNRFKNELIRMYREKYKDHSLLEDFIKHSGLLNNKKNIHNSILNFETNIVFDKDNYILHRYWGVGKIKAINDQEIVVDFSDKKDHVMKVRMALDSLKPLPKDHFKVMEFNDPDKLKDLFENNIVEFFKLLVKSYDSKMRLLNIKTDLIGNYVDAKHWSKWWLKTKLLLLKEAFVVSPYKKDVIQLREESISYSDSIIEKFEASKTVEEKIHLALTAIKEYPTSIDVLDFIRPIFFDLLKNIRLEIRLQAWWVLELIPQEDDEEANKFKDDQLIESIINEVRNLNLQDSIYIDFCLKSTDLKRQFAKYLKQYNAQWLHIYQNLLLQLPIKNHKYLLSELAKAEEFEQINTFFSLLVKQLNSHAEVFLWTFKNLITDNIEVSDLNWTEQILSFFRLIRLLPKIEIKGTKLKNIVKDVLIGNLQKNLFSKIEEHSLESTSKIISLIKDIIVITDVEKESVYNFLKQHSSEDEKNENDHQKSEMDIERLILLSNEKNQHIASKNAINKMQEELEHIIQVDIPENSKEIGIAQEKGDLRENAEYKAAMEHQSILQSTVTKLEAQLKEIIPLAGVKISKNKITIGTKVRLIDKKTQDIFVYTIMDQWDADIDQGIISYHSPLGQALFNHQKGDVVEFQSADTLNKLKVEDISIVINNEGYLI